MELFFSNPLTCKEKSELKRIPGYEDKPDSGKHGGTCSELEIDNTGWILGQLLQ